MMWSCQSYRHLNLLIVSCIWAWTKGISRQTETPVSKETTLETCKKYLSRCDMSSRTGPFFFFLHSDIYKLCWRGICALQTPFWSWGLVSYCGLQVTRLAWRNNKFSEFLCYVSDGYRSQALSRTMFCSYLSV